MKMAQNPSTDREWRAFAKRDRAEMATPENIRTLDVLAALSHSANFSVGCYCENEAHCHRSLLRTLLEEKGARLEGARFTLLSVLQYLFQAIPNRASPGVS